MFLTIDSSSQRLQTAIPNLWMYIRKFRMAVHSLRTEPAVSSANAGVRV